MSGTIRIHVFVSETDLTQPEVVLFSEGAIMNAQFKQGLIEKARQAGLPNPVLRATAPIAANGFANLQDMGLEPVRVYRR
jgi:hypothetical protein